MKRKINVLLLVTLLSLMLFGCNGNEELVEEKLDDIGQIEEVDENVLSERLGFDRKDELEKAIKDRVEEGEYRKVSIDKIAINDDLGNEEEGYYIALVYLIFGVQNREKTANEMMRMYSDDLVATLANQGIKDISEAVVFWKDEYNNRDLKYAYEYKDAGFYLTDSME